MVSEPNTLNWKVDSVLRAEALVYSLVCFFFILFLSNSSQSLLMALETFVQPAIPRFDGHYDHWSMLMENFLRSKEYWHLVETGFPETESSALTDTQKTKLEEQRFKELKVKNYLFQAIDRTILETILTKDTSKQIWDAMRQKSQGTTKVKRAHLQALHVEFETLRMQPTESIEEYFSRTMSIANKMRTSGDKMADITIIEKIL